MAQYFPLWTDLEHAPVLIVGGGEQALDKAKKLLDFRPSITLVASNPILELRQLADRAGMIRKERTGWDPKEEIFLQKPILAILADQREEEIPPLFEILRENRIPVNTVDRPEFCTFFFSALIQRRHLTVAISTAGASPTAAKQLRNRLEQAIPPQTDSILDWLSELRPSIRAEKRIPKACLPDLYRQLVDTAFSLDRPLNPQETDGILAQYRV